MGIYGKTFDSEAECEMFEGKAHVAFARFVNHMELPEKLKWEILERYEKFVEQVKEDYDNIEKIS